MDAADVLDIDPTILFLASCPVPHTIDREILEKISQETDSEEMSLRVMDEYGSPRANQRH